MIFRPTKINVLTALVSTLSFSLINSYGAYAAIDTATNAQGLNVKNNDQLINYERKQLSQELFQDKQERAFSNALQADKITATNSDIENTLSQVWGFYTYGSGIGASGFYSGDFDGNDKQNLAFASGDGFGASTKISIVEFKDNQYVISHQEKTLNSAGVIDLVGAFDQSSDNHLLFISTDDGIWSYNLSAQIWTESLTTKSAQQLLLADIDNNGSDELIAVSTDQTNIFNISTKELIASYSFGGEHAAVGQFVAGGALEIAFGSGHVYQLSEQTEQLIWSYGEPFGRHLTTVNLDEDSSDELITAKSWYDIQAFDIDSQSKIWSYKADLDIDALLTFDIDGDGKKELLYGDGQWGSIHALDAASGERLWSLANPDHGVTNIMISDLDNDSELEIFWGAGYSSSGSDHLYVYDLEAKHREAKTKDISGPFNAYDIADVDSDGELEIIAISNKSNSGYDDGVIYVFNASTYELEWSTTEQSPFGGQAVTGLHDLSIADIDGDNTNEILVVTDTLYDGALYVLNGQNGELEFTKTLDRGSPLHAVTTADIDNDGQIEIITSGGIAHTGSPGRFIYVINGVNGEVEQTSPSLGNNWTDIEHIEVYDYNKDGNTDVVAILDGKVHIFDVTTGVLKTSQEQGFTALAKGIYQESESLLIGDEQGQILAVNMGLSTTVISNLCTQPIDYLSTISNTKVAFSCSDHIGLFDLTNSEIKWRHPVSNPHHVSYFEFEGKSRYLVGGDMLTLLQTPTSNTNLEALGQSMSTHAKQSVTTSLTATTDQEVEFFVLKPPKHGDVTFEDRTEGLITYTPDGDFIGEDNFSFIAILGGIESNEAIITIELVNQKPQTSDQTFTMHWRGESTFHIAAQDADGDALLYSLTTVPHEGELTLLNDSLGKVSYVSSDNSLEPISFNFTVTDGLESTEAAVATIHFSNTAPEGQTASVDTYYSSTLSGKFLATDADNDPMTYEVVTPPSKGKFEFEQDTGLFTYEPQGKVSYQDQVSYRVYDGAQYSQVQTVTFEVVGQAVPDQDKQEGSGGALSLLSLLMMGTLLFRRNPKKTLIKSVQAPVQR